MGLFSKDIKSMEDLFLHTLQDVYYAENQIVKSLPKMIEKSTNRELASSLRDHLAETKQQVSRLDQVFKALGQTPTGTDCPAMDGLIKEADNVSGEVDDKKVLDAAIIGGAQAIEHYEISRYGTLIAWAEELGHHNVIRFLKTARAARGSPGSRRRASGVPGFRPMATATGGSTAKPRLIWMAASMLTWSPQP